MCGRGSLKSKSGVEAATEVYNRDSWFYSKREGILPYRDGLLLIGMSSSSSVHASVPFRTCPSLPGRDSGCYALLHIAVKVVVGRPGGNELCSPGRIRVSVDGM